MKRAFLALGILAVALPVWAQSGGISGTVQDESGGLIPGAAVTVDGPGGTQTATSGRDGAFAFSGLDAGTYTVTIEMSGFSTQVQENIAVAAATIDVGSITMPLAPLGETIVVSASKVESTLTNAPATLSVVTSSALQNAPSQNFGDILRNVPGVNVIQMGARDMQLTSRQATSTLNTSQLTLLDGRSIYLDFFGFVMWDLIPSNPDVIKQIEVVRGPASAVWGANALTGVVNIITKSPRESEGLSLSLTSGFFNRDGGTREDDGNGTAYGGSLTYADAPSDTLSYRIAAGYYNSDPFSRPLGVQTLNHPLAGTIPCSGAPFTGCVPIGTHPQDSSIITGGAPYPVDSPDVPFGVGFANSGTSQPKLDLRIDRELSSGGQLSFSGGVAGTEGIVHTGIGPFDVQSGSYMYYGKVGFTKGAFKLQTFVNLLDVEAPNLLLTDPATLEPVALNFKTQTFDLELGHSAVVGGNHILSYGGNARRNNFDITLTPNAEDRNEFGAYFQDEMHWDKFRISVGGRVDKFGNIEDPVFSPRVTLMLKPTPDHSIRVSYNKAFRSPSAVNNYLDQAIFAPDPVDLSPLAPFLPPPLNAFVAQPIPLVVNNVGNPNLREESLTAYEVAYTGTFGGKTTFGLALYQNDTDDNINFVSVLPSASNPQGLPGLEFYSAADPPPGVPAVLVGILAQLPAAFGGPILLPKTVSTYHNLGPIRQVGIEVSLDHRFNNKLSGFANYSFQDTPEVLEAAADQIPYPTEEVGLAPRHRINVGVNLSHDRFVGSAHYSYTDEAFWGDVLSTPFHGMTDSFSMLNASFGIRWAEGKVTTTLKGTNLTNATIQQHIFGDIIKRSVFAEVRVRLD